MKPNLLSTLSFLFLAFFIFSNIAKAETATSLDQEIVNRKTEIDQLNKRIKVYQENIEKKQSEAASLLNQLAILENQIAKTNLDIEATNVEIKEVQLETRNTELKIISAEDNIDRQKGQLSELIHQLYEADQQNAIQIFLLNDSISEFYNQLEFAKELQNSLQTSLADLKSEKKQLLDQQKTLVDKKAQFVALKQDLEAEKVELTAKTLYKDNLLIETRNSEKKFSNLYWQAKREQDAISTTITNLEKKKRQAIEEANSRLGTGALVWPIPKNKVTAYFHDPGYPFRYLFEHPAIDVRSAQGTSIMAPADGYVLQAVDNGLGYSYIALIHGNDLSTVYGHVSKIYVAQDQFVKQGTIIGATGGMPGTPGAGRLSSGPHLHFEIRKNGIPVNPLDYLH